MELPRGQASRYRVVMALSVVFLLLAGQRAEADSLTVLWDPSPDPSVIGYVVYVGTASGLYTEAFDVGSATMFTFAGAHGGSTYYFAVASYAPGPLVGPPSPEVAGLINAAPSLAPPGDQTSTLGESVSLQLSGSDPEGAALTYSAAGMPPGLTLDSRIGVIFGAGTAVGKYLVTASVSDGELSASRSFAWTIDGTDNPPPPAVTLISPSGSISTDTPTFVWKAAAGATMYTLWVDDASSGDSAILQDYTPTQAGCATGSGECAVTPGVALAVGTATWSAMASNAAGSGPWSAGMEFVVPSPPEAPPPPDPGDTIAPAVDITSPSGTGTTYTTSKNSVALKGIASDEVGVTKVTWTNDRGGSGTASGTTSWSTSSLKLQTGTNVFTVTAFDAAGNSRTATLTVVLETAKGGGGPGGGGGARGGGGKK